MRWERAAEDAARAPWIPGHVRACRANNLPAPPWFLAIWQRSTPTSQTRIPYTCGSYRCPSVECQKAAAHKDFARINEALEAADDGAQQYCRLPGYVFFVLTIDQHGTQGQKHFENEQEAFRELSKMTRYFLKQLRREQKRRGWRVLQNEWVATVEVQKNGWPHINLIVLCPELAAELRRDDETLAECGLDERGRKLVRGRVLDFTLQAKWGRQSTAEAARSSEALAGYVTKLAGDLERTAGEVAKITQTPTNARMKLRRVRAGKGFLRTRQKNESFTGIMVRHRTEYGRRVPETLMSPEQVKPTEPEPKKMMGETKESFARRHCAWVARAHAEMAGYLEGVRHALDQERAYIRAEFEGMARPPARTGAEVFDLGDERRKRAKRETREGDGASPWTANASEPADRVPLVPPPVVRFAPSSAQLETADTS